MKDIKILFNLEGNNEIGMGHITECLRLENKFREIYSSIRNPPERNVSIRYLFSHDSQLGIEKLKESGYDVRVVDRDDFDSYMKEIKRFNPDVVINDILYIKKEYSKKLRTLDTLVVDIQHIPNAESLDYSDIIFNSLYPPSKEVPGKYYFGPSYISLPDQFKNLPKKEINEKCKNFLVCFGGSDPQGCTLKAIEALNKYGNSMTTVLIGPFFKYNAELNKLMKEVDNKRFILLRNTSNILPYILKADIGLVSGGHTINELAATGTPGVTLAQNQVEVERAKLFADHYGIIHNLGYAEKIHSTELMFHIEEFANDFELRKKLSKQGQRIQDGRGADRIVNVIMETLK